MMKFASSIWLNNLLQLGFRKKFPHGPFILPQIARSSGTWSRESACGLESQAEGSQKAGQ